MLALSFLISTDMCISSTSLDNAIVFQASNCKMTRVSPDKWMTMSSKICSVQIDFHHVKSFDQIYDETSDRLKSDEISA
jgi:hypothetical protein